MTLIHNAPALCVNYTLKTKNTGSVNYQLSSGDQCAGYGKNYKISITAVNDRNIYDHSNDTFTIQAVVPLDPTPRIAMRWGMVNQYVDARGNWISDPDGISGSNIDKLTYCKKWYPNTVKVESYKREMIVWKEAGNRGTYSFEVLTDKCIQGEPPLIPMVKVLSPNGGEVYEEGQKITVKWETKNIPITSRTAIVLHDKSNGNKGWNVYSTNDGEEVFTLPVSIYDWNILNHGKNFEIIISFSSIGTPYREDQLVDYSDSTFTIQNSKLDPTSRIAYKYGLVNQHVDSQGNWQTDPDGSSGADIDKLTYCKKWYPNTVKVEQYKTETINTWRAGGNYGLYSYTVMTDKCVQEGGVPPGKTDPSTLVSLITNGCAGTKYNTNTGELCINQTTPKFTRTLKIGVPKSIEVQELQSVLGIKADGIFGKGTAQAVKDWQALQGLTADGAFGPKSSKILLEQISL